MDAIRACICDGATLMFGDIEMSRVDAINVINHLVCGPKGESP